MPSFHSMCLNLLLLTLSLIPSATPYNQVSSALVELQIRNKLSLYALALDRKEFSLYAQVFAPNVVVNYTTPSFPLITDLLSLEKFEASEVNISATTQHSITSTVVEEQQAGSESALNSTADFIATYLGKDKNQGKNAQVIGSYVDEWEAVTQNGKEEANYLIKKRTLLIIGIVGDPAVVVS